MQSRKKVQRGEETVRKIITEERKEIYKRPCVAVSCSPLPAIPSKGWHFFCVP